MTVILSAEELTQIRQRPRGAQAQLARCQDQPYEQSTQVQWMSVAIDLGIALGQADRDVVVLLDALEAALTETQRLNAIIDGFTPEAWRDHRESEFPEEPTPR